MTTTMTSVVNVTSPSIMAALQHRHQSAHASLKICAVSNIMKPTSSVKGGMYRTRE